MNAPMSQVPEQDEESEDDAAPPPIKTKRDPPLAESNEKLPSLAFQNGQAAGKPDPPEVDELGYPTASPPSEPITDFSWRNFSSSINLLRIMQKICKNKAHRNLLLVQYKSSNILKKSLKIPQPDLRLYTPQALQKPSPLLRPQMAPGKYARYHCRLSPLSSGTPR